MLAWSNIHELSSSVARGCVQCSQRELVDDAWMVDVQYRMAHHENVPAMTDLFLAALGDLYTRNNIPATLPPRAETQLGYEHVCTTGIFHVAEWEGKIVAIAGAVVRDYLWYLSAFWARPDLQQRKIGMTLLRCVWEVGKQDGATIFFT